VEEEFGEVLVAFQEVPEVAVFGERASPLV
jgi:hypothetical protein